MINNTKGKIFINLFMLSGYFSKNPILRIIGLPVRLFYKIFVQWMIGIDIPDTTFIGKNFNVFHGQGLVINSNTMIGDNVTVRHNTTIGVAKDGGKSPVIKNNVNIGANVVVIGEITIGANSIIAAGSVVIKDVPENSIVAGNPAKIIKKLRNEE